MKKNTMYSVCLFLCLFSSSTKDTLASFTSSTFSTHSSTGLSTNLILQSQFSYSKYSPMSHDLFYLYNYKDPKYIFYHIQLSQSTLCIHVCIYLHFTFVFYFKHLHQVYIYIYTFHAFYVPCFISS